MSVRDQDQHEGRSRRKQHTERGRDPGPGHKASVGADSVALPRQRYGLNGNNNNIATISASACSSSQALIPQTEANGLMQHMRHKLTNNIEHYSNILQDIALPVLFASRNRNRSGSRNRGKGSLSRDRNKRNSSPFPDRASDDEDFVFSDNIELCQLDGFNYGGSRESGRGHRFVVVHLKSPTWCDKCGDFIWGVYKQCLCCKSESNMNFVSNNHTICLLENKLTAQLYL